jgi:ABC-type amino acid transport substrate-binding protein
MRLTQTLMPVIFAAGLAVALPSGASAQQVNSHLFTVTKNHTLKVCNFDGYYAISYRNPTSGQLEGLDVDMAKALAKSLGAKLQFVETSFGTFIADVETNKCDVAMFGIGITLQRAQAVEFTNPYLQTGIYAVVRKGGPIKSWADIDKPGMKIAVTLGSYIEPFMKSYLKQATLVPIAPPATREQELMAHHVDAEIVDYPTAQKVESSFDWAVTITPPTRLMSTPMGYAVAPGDQIWLNYLNLFVATMKRTGELKTLADKNHLGPIVAP